MKKSTILLALGLVVFVSLGVWFVGKKDEQVIQSYPQDNLAKSTLVTPSGGEVELMIAESDEDRVRGLSGYPNLSSGQGMLFIFPELGNHGIWMKDMNFPIDMVWLNEGKEIVHLVKGAEPSSYPDTVFFPSRPAKYVVELKAGDAQEFALQEGQILSF